MVVVLGTGLLTAATSGRESPGSDDRDRQVPSQVPNAQESETPGKMMKYMPVSVEKRESAAKEVRLTNAAIKSSFPSCRAALGVGSIQGRRLERRCRLTS